MSDTESQPQGNKKIKELRVRQKLRKALPTNRVNFSKQLDILRASAAASGSARNPISNDDVSKIVNLHFGTVSNCNPFFIETGLLTRHKMLSKPCDEVFAYAERYEWDKDKAALKLAPKIRGSWFCSLLIPKLTFRSLTIDEAISFLAEEAGAGKEYKDQLAMLLDYLRAAGIVTIEGNSVSIVKSAVNDDEIPTTSVERAPPKETDSESRIATHNDDHNDLDPFIVGLLKTLPPPKTDWPIAGRVKWLQTAANIFGLIYTDPNGNELEFIEIAKKQL